jgi:hypothetical protein
MLPSLEASTSQVATFTTESSGRIEFQTYIILYTNEVTEYSSINCSVPDKTEETFQIWTAPSGVQIMKSENGTMNHNKGKQVSNAVWVELMPDNSLVFHNPDNSLSGPYTCLTLGNDQDVFQTTVWVHVMEKSFFDISGRLTVACLTSGAFLAMTLGSYACYYRRMQRAGYSLARRQEDNFEIPQIVTESAPS